MRVGTHNGAPVYVETLQVRAIMPTIDGATVIDVGGGDNLPMVEEGSADVAALIELGRRVDAQVDRALGIKRQP